MHQTTILLLFYWLRPVRRPQELGGSGLEIHRVHLQLEGQTPIRNGIQLMMMMMMSFTLTPRQSDMQATTTIYIRVCTCIVFHFLKTNLEPRQRPVVA